MTMGSISITYRSTIIVLTRGKIRVIVGCYRCSSDQHSSAEGLHLDSEEASRRKGCFPTFRGTQTYPLNAYLYT